MLPSSLWAVGFRTAHIMHLLFIDIAIDIILLLFVVILGVNHYRHDRRHHHLEHQLSCRYCQRKGHRYFQNTFHHRYDNHFHHHHYLHHYR